MAKIDELLQELCPDGVEYAPLGCCANVVRGERVTKKQLLEFGAYPVISGGVSPMGFLDKFNRKKDTITVAQYGTAGYVSFQEKDFWANDVCYSVYPEDNLLNKYLWYYLKSKQEYIYQIRNTDAVPYSLPPEKLKSVQIALPPHPIQQHIVEVLDTFTDAISNLEEELALREKQFEYYREQLLSFDNETSLGKQLYSSLIDWQTLSEVAEIGTGGSNTKDGLSQGLYPFYTRGQDILWKNEYEFDEEAIITAGDGVGVGKTIHYVKGKYALHQRAYRFSPKKTLLGKFLFYYMKVSFYQYVCGKSVSSSVSSLRKPKLMAYPIPILPIEKQHDIVEILDTFEAMIANIKEEIALRTKQYEYYREKLISFGK